MALFDRRCCWPNPPLSLRPCSSPRCFGQDSNHLAWDCSPLPLALLSLLEGRPHSNGGELVSTALAYGLAACMRYQDLVHLLLPWAEHWSFGLVAAHEHWSFCFGLVALLANRCFSPAMLVATAIRPIPLHRRRICPTTP